jgi:two-component system, OmpR family, sensor histidine kinase BaeS
MRFVGLLIGVCIVAYGVVELLMRPSGQDRTMFALMFAGIAVVTALLWLVLRSVAIRARSLSGTMFVVSVGAVFIVVLAVVAAGRLMFLSGHDLHLTLIVLGFGVVLGALLAGAVAERLSRDLHRLRDIAEQVAAGDFSARAGLNRPDEVGALSSAIDSMVERLDAADIEQQRIEASRRTFLAAIGHDLRTPLTSARAAVEALQDGVARDPERFLASISGDLSILSGLVEDLFLLSKIEADQLDLHMEPVDLTDLADTTLEAMAPVARRRSINLRLDATTHVRVQAGELELARVLRNLVDNAIRHAPDASEVTVGVDSDQSSVTVRVTDQGSGFPPDIDVFESFTRGDSARARDTGGAGLGLAIARGIVDAHGGATWIEPGPGGTIAFRIPIDRSLSGPYVLEA